MGAVTLRLSVRVGRIRDEVPRSLLDLDLFGGVGGGFSAGLSWIIVDVRKSHTCAAL